MSLTRSFVVRCFRLFLRAAVTALLACGALPLFERVAFAAAPVVLEPVKFVPIYCDNTKPEVQAAFLVPFYSDFTHQWISNGFTESLAEYGNAGKTMSYTQSYDLSSRYPEPSGTTLTDSQIQSILVLGIIGAPIVGKPPVLPDPGCGVPSAGQTNVYSQSAYVMHLPPGVSAPNCAYHGFTKYQKQAIVTVGGSSNVVTYTCNFAYAVVSDHTPGNGNGCDLKDSVATTYSGMNAEWIDEYSVVLSHELVEMTVNPFGGPQSRCPLRRGPWGASRSPPPRAVARRHRPCRRPGARAPARAIRRRCRSRRCPERSSSFCSIGEAQLDWLGKSVAAPGSVPKKAPTPWDPEAPFSGFGYRSIDESAKGEVRLSELPVRPA